MAALPGRPVRSLRIGDMIPGFFFSFSRAAFGDSFGSIKNRQPQHMKRISVLIAGEWQDVRSPRRTQSLQRETQAREGGQQRSLGCDSLSSNAGTDQRSGGAEGFGGGRRR